MHTQSYQSTISRALSGSSDCVQLVLTRPVFPDFSYSCVPLLRARRAESSHLRELLGVAAESVGDTVKTRSPYQRVRSRRAMFRSFRGTSVKGASRLGTATWGANLDQPYPARSGGRHRSTEFRWLVTRRGICLSMNSSRLYRPTVHLPPAQ